VGRFGAVSRLRVVDRAVAVFGFALAVVFFAAGFAFACAMGFALCAVAFLLTAGLAFAVVFFAGAFAFAVGFLLVIRLSFCLAASFILTAAYAAVVCKRGCQAPGGGGDWHRAATSATVSTSVAVL